jgi:hypothetical protein
MCNFAAWVTECRKKLVMVLDVPVFPVVIFGSIRAGYRIKMWTIAIVLTIP